MVRYQFSVFEIDVKFKMTIVFAVIIFFSSPATKDLEVKT